jgi:hypothetical protein
MNAAGMAGSLPGGYQVNGLRQVSAPRPGRPALGAAERSATRQLDVASAVLVDELILFVAGWVAVANADDPTAPFNFERDLVGCGRNGRAGGVEHADADRGRARAASFQEVGRRRQAQGARGCGGDGLVFGDQGRASKAARHKRPGRGGDRPLQMCLAWHGLAAQALAVQQQLDLLGVGIDPDGEPIARDIERWFASVAPRLERGYLFGGTFSVADAYLFVMARGALQLGFPLGEAFETYVARIEARPAVQAALHRETAAQQVVDGEEVR